MPTQRERADDAAGEAMTEPLARAHLEAQRRLRALASRGVENTWAELPGHDDANVDQWLSLVLPLVLAAQRQSVRLTDAYLARALSRAPLGVNAAGLSGTAVRNGTSPEEQWRRPFIQLWAGLGAGRPFEAASAAASARASGMAATDVQLSSRATYGEVQRSDSDIRGWVRTANGGACRFCAEVDGAFVKEADAMPLHNGCVTGDSVVWAPPPGRSAQASSFGGAHAATRRRYDGEVVVLETAAGHDLTVTPNHPILTDRGWVGAGLLREGDNVVSSRWLDGICEGVPDEENMPARIEDLFRAGAMGAPVAVPFTAEQFHGDRGDGEVHVVALDGRLDAGSLAALLQPPQHLLFPGRSRLALGFACSCGRDQRRLGVRHSTFRGVRRRRSGESLGFRLARGGDQVLLARRALRDPSRTQMAVDHAAVDAVSSGDGEHGISGGVFRDCAGNVDHAPARRQTTLTQGAAERLGVDPHSARRLLHRLAGEVQLDRLVSVSGRYVATHVFNLVTRGGWYTANAIVTHNCGCGLEPVFATAAPTPLPDTVAVHEHGELGPVLGDPAHDFTTL